MTDSIDMRENAARFYEKALTPVSGGVCGAPPGRSIAATVGYGLSTLADIPADAAGNSFGCGNPLAFAGVKPGDTVLDLGSGAGLDLIIAARKTGPTGRVIGVDASDVMLARARANAEQAGLTNVELRLGGIENLPVASDSVDWVISNCVINLASDKERVFHEIRRVLKPGGHMLVSDIVADGLPDWIKANPELHAGYASGALAEQDYLDAIRRAGLTDISVVDRLLFDDSALRFMVSEALPVSLEPLACSSGKSVGEIIDAVVAAASGRMQSLRIAAQRPFQGEGAKRDLT